MIRFTPNGHLETPRFFLLLADAATRRASFFRRHCGATAANLCRSASPTTDRGNMASSSSNSTMRVRRRPDLPLILCPECGWRKVMEHTSRTPGNPGKVFFTCPNQQKGKRGCGFYLWEEDYVKYLRDNLGIVVRDEVDAHDSECPIVGLGADVGGEDREDGGIKRSVYNADVCVLLRALLVVCVF